MALVYYCYGYYYLPLKEKYNDFYTYLIITSNIIVNYHLDLHLRGTGICISDNDGILFLLFLDTKLIFEERRGFGSSSKFLVWLNRQFTPELHFIPFHFTTIWLLMRIDLLFFMPELAINCCFIGISLLRISIAPLPPSTRLLVLLTYKISSSLTVSISSIGVSLLINTITNILIISQRKLFFFIVLIISKSLTSIILTHLFIVTPSFLENLSLDLPLDALVSVLCSVDSSISVSSSSSKISPSSRSSLISFFVWIVWKERRSVFIFYLCKDKDDAIQMYLNRDGR
ncbi:hypothetical protein AGLY_000329 [Aphis glycines]|uniref:Uncharacterized protein n=1 Tax=Aphis glycines TaxID=307491 RepID=A0A6G0U758_APHGL|nr:hypothetical protein AGLY_000329 [Aphis glycines]